MDRHDKPTVSARVPTLANPGLNRFDPFCTSPVSFQKKWPSSIGPELSSLRQMGHVPSPSSARPYAPPPSLVDSWESSTPPCWSWACGSPYPPEEVSSSGWLRLVRTRGEENPHPKNPCASVRLDHHPRTKVKHGETMNISLNIYHVGKTQCHKRTSHHHFYRCYQPFPVMLGFWHCFSHIIPK